MNEALAGKVCNVVTGNDGLRYGFILTDNGQRLFFHRLDALGAVPRRGDRVEFSADHVGDARGPRAREVRRSQPI